MRNWKIVRKWEKMGEGKRLVACFLIAVMIRHYIVTIPKIRETIGLPWFFGIFAAIALMVFLLYWFGRHTFRYKTMDEVDAMDQDDFEDYLVRLFAKLGYRKKRRTSSEGGILLEKHGRKTVVYTHRTKGLSGTESLEKLLACMNKRECSGLFVCTSGYTIAATELAKKHDIEVWDRAHLEKTCLAVNKRKQFAALQTMQEK